jgi:hypothetical protein
MDASRGKIMRQPYKRIGWPTVAGLGLVVVAFMVLSLLVTATGTARFAVSMGYDANVGYAIGAVFDVAKGMLLVGVVALWGRGALGVSAVFAIGWICLVTFSWLATHATVGTAISSIERTGTWKMEMRGNTKTELSNIDQRLAALSRPTPPRPAKTVQEALAAERVPPSVWQDSQECGRIQESAHFARACTQVVQLRRELAAARDYERLSSQATELRKGLAEAPILATADPLPAAFSATTSPPFHQRERKSPNIRTIMTSNDVMGGPSTFTLLYTTGKFHDANPKVYAAFLKALEEAIAAINADKRAAAQTFLDMEGQGLKLDEVLEILNDPDIRYTTSPENLMKYAEFMNDVGSIKARPSNWREMFFPAIHHVPGS